MTATVLVFSKDRAMQLDALIWSYLLHVNNDDTEKHILYKTSTPQHARQYAHLEKQYPGWNFVKEGLFKQSLLGIKMRDTVMWLVDDTVFLREFNVQECCLELSDSHIAGVSLRLGRNCTYCYPSSKEQSIPNMAQVGRL